MRPSSTLVMSEEEFRLLREFINAHSGFAFSGEAIRFLERRLIVRVTALGLGSFSEYYRYLRYHPAKATELSRLMDAVTTNETYFFREIQQLNVFRDQVLPELHALAAPRKSLTVWSAGCSTGEEVYSLAMLIDESRLFEGWNVCVFGNDISQRVVHIARTGVFRQSSFKAMPPQYMRYFADESEGRSVIPRIRRWCSFGHFNLLDERQTLMMGYVDAIVCRNVLIYLDNHSREKIIHTFYERLHPGGYLLLGHSESLLYASTTFDFVHLRGDLAYRKGSEVRRNGEGGSAL